MFETWAAIPGYEGRWEVSTEGRIWSIPRPRTRGGFLKLGTNKRGYLSVGLGDESHEVHRLVALAFLGPRPPGMEVRHIDGVAHSGVQGILAYGTRSENNRDQIAHGTNPQKRKTHCPQGHPYVGDNVLTIPSRPNARYCRACHNRRSSRANRVA